MIQTELYMTRSDGVNLYRTYSDADLMIQKVGTDETYSEAIDVENSGFTYTETDIPIEHDEPTSDTEQKAEAFDYLTGRTDNEQVS